MAALAFCIFLAARFLLTVFFLGVVAAAAAGAGVAAAVVAAAGAAGALGAAGACAKDTAAMVDSKAVAIRVLKLFMVIFHKGSSRISSDHLEQA